MIVPFLRSLYLLSCLSTLILPDQVESLEHSFVLTTPAPKSAEEWERTLRQPISDVSSLSNSGSATTALHPLSENPFFKGEKTVYITPGFWGELFAIDNPVYNRDNCLNVMYELREEAARLGISILQANDLDALKEFDYLVVYDVFPQQIEQLKKFPPEKLILFLWEPPSVIPENYDPQYHQIFSKVYTWRDDLVDNIKYYKFHYPVLKPLLEQPIDFSFRRLSTMIVANKNSSFPGELYTERQKLIEFYEARAYQDFDLFGKWWPTSYVTYQGSVDKKIDYLKYYKFCYTYENIRDVPGYVTEKIFDALEAGTVPIYWGASNVTEYVPPECFVDRRNFTSNDDLYEFLKSMPEEEHAVYLENIRNFLKSTQASLFSRRHFINTFIKLIGE